MKEATGELNMTVVTIVAIAAVALLFYIFLWPVVQRSIVNQTCKTYGADYEAVSTGDAIESSSGATVKKWLCCPDGDASSEKCIDANIADKSPGGNNGGNNGGE